MVTETDDLSVMLDAAQQHWPGLARRQALLRLVDTGAQVIAAQDAQSHHAQTVAALTAFAGTFGPDYRDSLRAEWPA
jgi:hypothetical protein